MCSAVLFTQRLQVGLLKWEEMGVAVRTDFGVMLRVSFAEKDTVHVESLGDPPPFFRGLNRNGGCDSDDVDVGEYLPR